RWARYFLLWKQVVLGHAVGRGRHIPLGVKHGPALQDRRGAARGDQAVIRRGARKAMKHEPPIADRSDRRENYDANDDAALRRLGYAQELLRRMGGFSSFAVSFSIISVLTGCITAYSDALAAGGPAALGIGWPLVSAGTLLVALAMAELASAFPTAGALYHWSALLWGAGWGWLTASVDLVGQLALVPATHFRWPDAL